MLLQNWFPLPGRLSFLFSTADSFFSLDLSLMSAPERNLPLITSVGPTIFTSFLYLVYNNYINLLFVYFLLFFFIKKIESSLITGAISVLYHTPSALVTCQEHSGFCCILISVCSKEKLQYIFASHFFNNKRVVWDMIFVNKLDNEKATKTGLVI